jgi:hypothetical protein
MSAFEYASGLISIVIGLAVARVLGGISSFIAADERSGSDWIVASWCFALLFNLVAWWLVGWEALHERAEIDLAILFGWILATSPLYAAAHVLVPDAAERRRSEARTILQPLRGVFYLCLGVHYVLATFMTMTMIPPDAGRALPMLALIILGSAAGVFARTNRARALHLLTWLALVGVLAASVPTLG